MSDFIRSQIDADNFGSLEADYVPLTSVFICSQRVAYRVGHFEVPRGR